MLDFTLQGFLISLYFMLMRFNLFSFLRCAIFGVILSEFKVLSTYLSTFLNQENSFSLQFIYTEKEFPKLYLITVYILHLLFVQYCLHFLKPYSHKLPWVLRGYCFSEIPGECLFHGGKVMRFAGKVLS